MIRWVELPDRYRLRVDSREAGLASFVAGLLLLLLTAGLIYGWATSTSKRGADVLVRLCFIFGGLGCLLVAGGLAGLRREWWLEVPVRGRLTRWGERGGSVPDGVDVDHFEAVPSESVVRGGRPRSVASRCELVAVGVDGKRMWPFRGRSFRGTKAAALVRQLNEILGATTPANAFPLQTVESAWRLHALGLLLFWVGSLAAIPLAFVAPTTLWPWFLILAAWVACPILTRRAQRMTDGC